jgi:hypothetical protein
MEVRGRPFSLKGGFRSFKKDSGLRKELRPAPEGRGCLVKLVKLVKLVRRVRRKSFRPEAV